MVYSALSAFTKPSEITPEDWAKRKAHEWQGMEPEKLVSELLPFFVEFQRFCDQNEERKAALEPFAKFRFADPDEEIDCADKFGLSSIGCFDSRKPDITGADLIAAREAWEGDGCQATSSAEGETVSRESAPQLAVFAEAVMVPALVEAANRGLPVDTQELLIHGDATRGIPSGILLHMLRAAQNHQSATPHQAGRGEDADGATKSDQAYQVIGTLASEAGCFEHEEVQRALDYFSEDRFDPDFLPFLAPSRIDEPRSGDEVSHRGNSQPDTKIESQSDD